MVLEMETIVAASLVMAVFSAAAAVGSSIVLGVGFERLRAGFEVIRKQTGFFADAMHKLEGKVEEVDKSTASFKSSLSTLEQKVEGVGEQANAFTDALVKLEKKVDLTSAHEEVIQEKLEKSARSDVISTGKAEALVSHAEGLLGQVSLLAEKIHDTQQKQMVTSLSQDDLDVHESGISLHVLSGDSTCYH